MSIQAINNYHNEIHKIYQFSGQNHEQAIKTEFQKLINHYCEKRNLKCVSEINIKNKRGDLIRPDGIVKNNLRLDCGYWESKANVDLNKEVINKINAGYPLNNTLFQDDKNAILYQNDQLCLQAPLVNERELDKLLTLFVSYESKDIKEFNAAIEQFKQDLPHILDALRDMISVQEKTNKAFIHARYDFLAICQHSINPEITLTDVNEMLLQHILTEEIFTSIFSDSQFHRENNIAKELYKVESTFFSGTTKRNTLGVIQHYYNVIKASSAHIADHHDKQFFLKSIYENFYKAYNPKAADRLGIVYTPHEIVQFQIESVDTLLEKHFNKSLADEGIKILDPCTGTGTYICELCDYLPPHRLAYKYQHDIFANELGLLSYYIANLNIEYTYQQKMGQYEEFNHICWVDTLDNTGFGLKGTNTDLFGLSVENTERIKTQNAQKISVIIGNPPYNANQADFNDFNANKAYKEIDERIKNSYVNFSTAMNRANLYDMYTRFYRWASERLDKEHGIISFITNSSFINKKAFDGFRKCISDEFDFIYIIDLGGDIRELSGKDGIFLNEQHTIFGKAAAVGIAIMFLVKTSNKNKSASKLYYIHPCDIRATRDVKLEYLKNNSFEKIAFDLIKPDKNNNWINQSDNDFESLLPFFDKNVKAGKSEQAIFKLFSLGVATHRDDWVCDFDKNNLENKMRFFVDIYQATLKDTNFKDKNLIKYDRELNKYLDNKVSKIFESDKIVKSIYRPFTRQFLYFDKHFNGMTYRLHDIFGFNNEYKNLVICIGGYERKPFVVLITNFIPNLNFFGDPQQCLPLYVYDKEGNQHDNITDWALNQFQNRYENLRGFKNLAGLSKTDIFHYVYAVLHNPAYREKYQQNLKREFPRIPFYDDFEQWADWGKQLMDLHLNYETAELYPLKRQDLSLAKIPKTKLKADKAQGLIFIDDNTTLSDIPASAWEYKLGNRCALEWVLDQYKEKKPKDPTIAEKFNTYHFADYKEQVIELLMRVCTVSVATVKIVQAMNKNSQ